jgi:hypothetical protein
MMAKTYAKTVTVPTFDEQAAYNQERPISSLIRTQLLHLTTVENLRLPKHLRTGININTLHTEQEAGIYIQRVTAALCVHGAAEAPRAPSRRRTKSAAKRRTKRAKNAPRK